MGLWDEEKRALLTNIQMKSLRGGIKVVFVKLDFLKEMQRERKRERTEWSEGLNGGCGILG